MLKQRSRGKEGRVPGSGKGLCKSPEAERPWHFQGSERPLWLGSEERGREIMLASKREVPHPASSCEPCEALSLEQEGGS